MRAEQECASACMVQECPVEQGEELGSGARVAAIQYPWCELGCMVLGDAVRRENSVQEEDSLAQSWPFLIAMDVAWVRPWELQHGPQHIAPSPAL
jgi:hypothetical protein